MGDYDDDDDDFDLGQAAPVLQEALGVTPAGTCVRHPNCPVLSLAHNKVMSCRVCFSEEKSVGIRQRKSFAAVVQQLQQMGDTPKVKKSETSDDDENRRKIQRAHSANMQALILQQPQTMDSVMKRLAQVQNWVLRQKEKEVLSLQLQIQRLEERLYEAESQNQEQKQTIWALRRTIQQDLKIIKTMAVHKERELIEASPNSNDGTSAEGNNFSPPRRFGTLSIASSAASTPSQSPMHQGAINPNSINKLQSKLQKVKRNSSNHSGVASAYLGKDDDEDESENNNRDIFVEGHSVRSTYWNDAEYAGLATDPSKIFASFRGGLLDIPKSPPRDHHDKGRKNKLKLDMTQMAQLTVPRMRGVHRAFSEDGSVASGIGGPTLMQLSQAQAQREIPMNMLAAKLTSLPFEDSPAGKESMLDQASPEPGRTNAKVPIRSVSGEELELEVLQLGDGTDDPSYRMLVDKSKSTRSMLSTTYSVSTLASTKHTEVSKGGSTGMPSLSTSQAGDGVEDRSFRMLGEKSKSNSSMMSSTYSIGTMTSTKHLDVSKSRLTATPSFSTSFSTSQTFGVIGVDVTNEEEEEEVEEEDAAPEDAAKKEEEDDDDDDDSSDEGADDKTIDTTPTFFNESKSMLGEIDGAIEEEERDEEGKKEAGDEDPEYFLFTVTGAACQDKYGDQGLYSGTILVTEGMPNGAGTMNYESGRMYSGGWSSGQWHGQGKLLNANGDTYEGEFVYDARHGKGLYKWDNGDVYTGDFCLDKREGKGRFCFHNGNVYEGEFTDGMFEGFGKYTFEDGYYEGEWKDGRYNGDGELQYAKGGKYVGEFRESLANGFGMEVLPDGTKRRGVWEKGQPVELFDKP